MCNDVSLDDTGKKTREGGGRGWSDVSTTKAQRVGEARSERGRAALPTPGLQSWALEL